MHRKDVTRPVGIVRVLSIGFAALGLANLAVAGENLPAQVAVLHAVIVNSGQWDDSVLACVNGRGLNIWLTSSGWVVDATVRIREKASLVESAVAFAEPDPTSEWSCQTTGRLVRDVAFIRFNGATISAATLETRDTIGLCGFYLGPDPRRWVASVPLTTSLVCRNIYPGIDMSLAVEAGSCSARFLVHPGADRSAIPLDASVSGWDSWAGQPGISRKGQFGDFMIRFIDEGVAKDRDGGSSTAAAIEYSTYLGGTNYDAVYGLAFGADGSIFAAGNSESADFPTLNAYDPLYSGGTFGDVFVTKLPASGAGLVYSTYIGGTAADIVTGIAVDAAGSAYLTGITGSLGSFPLVGAFDSTYAGLGDAFILKLSPLGSQLVYSTFLGGGLEDYPRALAIDGAGRAYVCGHTRSQDFPTVGGMDSDFNGGSFDAFAARLAASGAALEYSTYLGGSSDDQAFGAAVDQQGRLHVRGWTASGDFPTVNALDGTYNGGERDNFVLRLNPNGSALEYSTYIGGSDSDYGVGLALDTVGCVYIAGATRSADFPLQNAYDSTLGGLQDLFVAKLDSNGQGLVFSTYLGGSAEDFNGIAAVDGCGQVFVTGYTYSTDFPMVMAFDGEFADGADLIISGLSPEGAQLHHSSYLGGTGFEFANGIALRNGDMFIAGVTNSADFPAVESYADTLTGDYDGFITRISGFGVNECGCACICHADPGGCNGVQDIVDVVQTVNVAFRGAPPFLDPSPSCPSESTDVNCTNSTDIVDVVKMVNVAFRGANPATEFCHPCQP